MKTRSYLGPVTFPKYIVVFMVMASLTVGCAIHIALGIYSVNGLAFGLAGCMALLSILMTLRWATQAIASAIFLQPEIQKDQEGSRKGYDIKLH